jgi:cytochrome c biogenesis protein CcmG/thiol:disulfide interchange protein DsbE
VRKGALVAVIVVCAALVGLLGYGVASEHKDTSIDDAAAKGQRSPAPSDSLSLLVGGGKRSLADYRGKVVVLNFWASWCPPCVDELPLLERTQRGIERRGGTVLGVNTKDIQEDALAFVHRFHLTYPSLRDRDGAYADRYASTGFPETFVIDRKGRIAAVRRGPVDQRWLDETLPPLLAERA